MNWEPIIGFQAKKLLINKGFKEDDDNLSDIGSEIAEKSRQILSLCHDPNLDGVEAGLVIGDIQSGKTLSFTTVMALANDNGYKLVIVISGTKTNLHEQTGQRLQSDLLGNSRSKTWEFVLKPTKRDINKVNSFINDINLIDSSEYKEHNKTLVFVVLKEKSNLNKLKQLLQNVDIGNQNLPTLIIDDEADQASLNTLAKANYKAGTDNKSTVYDNIDNIRKLFARHTYLQYTATPQAPLLINLTDQLSANFVQLLESGKGYTGETTFFRDHEELVIPIPYDELDSLNLNSSNSIPKSLQSSLALFFVGVAIGKFFQEHDDQKHNRSMLVHPSFNTSPHKQYYEWIVNLKNAWFQRLKLPDYEPDRKTLLLILENSYNELCKTKHLSSLNPVWPTFDALNQKNLLIKSINDTQVKLVNSKEDPTTKVDWKKEYAFILVGGEKLNRGFTVEGLTITYMPRSSGKNPLVDTMLQRARFYGYREKYLGLCRVFLDNDTINSYKKEMEHNIALKNSLQEFQRNGRNLKDWSRDGIELAKFLNPTRDNVIAGKVIKNSYGGRWIKYEQPHLSKTFQNNNLITKKFALTLEKDLIEDEGHPHRTGDQKHLKAEVSLSVCLEFLRKLNFEGSNMQEDHYLVLKSLEKLGGKTAYVYLMSAKGLDDWKIRERKLENNQIQNLHQGRNSNTTSGELIYPGDSKIMVEESVTIQLFRLNLKDTEHEDVYSLAIWLPKFVSADTISVKY